MILKNWRDDMISLQKMNGQEFVLNADLIESLESTPDTVITLTTGKKILVENSLDDIVTKAIKYKQLTNQTIQIEPTSCSSNTIACC
jgi:flagellar protein FlbD